MNRIFFLVFLISFRVSTLDQEQSKLNDELRRTLFSSKSSYDHGFKTRHKVTELMRLGANPNIQYNNEPLLIHCFKIDLSFFHFFISVSTNDSKHELDFNSVDSKGNNILHTIASFPLNHDNYPDTQKAYKYVINKLLKAGVRINQKNQEGLTPGSVAQRNNCQFLLDCIHEFDELQEKENKEKRELEVVRIDIKDPNKKNVKKSKLSCCSIM